ncbi:hypothetical protein ACF1BE_34815 [Streptomyces sp. NPDC014991]|uniref:hypothetical protein n=1 Tax=Streptomyces sp. NPDC014991 TaxID=3364935 RepID=UPI0036FD8154
MVGAGARSAHPVSTAEPGGRRTAGSGGLASWRSCEDEQEAVASLVRRLRAQTWLVGGRDDEVIEAVHRHAAAVRSALEAVGCAVTVEPDLVRVHTPVEPAGLMLDGAAHGAESVRPSPIVRRQKVPPGPARP